MKVIYLALALSHGVAYGVSGNRLNEECQSNESLYCLGYASGIADTRPLFHNICLPDSSTYGQVELVVKKYLADHPDKLHQDAVILVLEALKEAFPCIPQE